MEVEVGAGGSPSAGVVDGPSVEVIGGMGAEAEVGVVDGPPMRGPARRGRRFSCSESSRYFTSRGFDGTAAAKTSERKRAVTKRRDDFMLTHDNENKSARNLQNLHRGRGEALAEEAA